MDFKALYEKQLKENEKIKEEHKDEIIRLESDYQADYDELEQGKEILAKAYKEHKIEIMQLKEKNDKWEYWASEVIYWSYTESLNILEKKELITGEDKPKPTILKVRDFGKEITELKEENKKLKEEHTQYRMDIDELKDKLHLYKASHTRITEENKKLKEVTTKNYQKQINMTLMGVEPATE